MSGKNPLDYQSFFRHLPGRYIAVLPDDPTFTIVAETEEHEQVALVKPGEIIGKPFFEAFPDTSKEYKKTGVSAIAESFRNVIRSRKPDTMPLIRYDNKNEDGAFVTRYWRSTHHPIFDAGGNLALIFQDTRDVTDEVSVDAQLEQTRRQLEAALSSGLIGTWLWDIKKDVVIGDKYMAVMFGASEEDAALGLPLETFVSLIHPEDRPQIQKVLQAALSSGEVFNEEYRTLRPDGTSRWVMARGRIERDAEGNALQFPGVLLDITDRKVSEHNLAFLAEAGEVLAGSLDYRQTLKSIAKLAVPTIADWCTVDILSEEQQLQQVAIEHRDPAKVKWAVELRKKQGPADLNAPTGLGKVLRTGKPEFYPHISDDLLVAVAKSDEELKALRTVGFSAAIIVPLIVNKQTVGGLTLITAEQKRHYTQSDLNMAQELARRASLAITNARLYDEAQRELAARKRLEDELRIANEELERRVEERTAQLAETNLNLQRSNQELQDFAYVASHDLQEPLRKIQAFGNLLQEEYAGQLGEGSDYLDRMRGAAARMSALIADILSFSRVTTKARGFEPVDLSVVVGEVIGDLETRIEETKAKVLVDRLPRIQADPMQMRQLLQNLIANALKFHKPDEAPVVKIKATTEISHSPRRKYCRVEVEDNGVGFDEKYLDRIFAVFQRLHGRDSYEGTGIGLAVCRKIVERHGGTITARSTPGEGATFIITLPVHHTKRQTKGESQ
ncbi:MAG TPA: ATP-binding protein [Candidatus Saccharimonadales bacterium]|nr:ATP-binding protein [Candidatus Saccharimonadales bacterium]